VTEERYDLVESRRSVRELYPVLLDAHGNVIDGFHRLRAEPDWRTETLEHIRTPTQLCLARIIANTHRRSVSREERAQQINDLARNLVEHDGVEKDELLSTIAELTTFSDDYVRRLLSDDYKLRPGVGGGAHEPVGLSPTEREEFDGALRGLGITVPTEAPRQGSEAEPLGISEEGIAEETQADLTESASDGEFKAEDYAREYFRSYPRPDEDFLAWELCRRFGVSDALAREIISEVKKERAGPRRAPREGSRFETRAPTCRCPLCGREGADRNTILMAVEDPELSQLTLTEFVEEGLRR